MTKANLLALKRHGALALTLLFLIMIFVIVGCGEQKRQQVGIPSSIDFADPNQLNSPSITGVYPDRWVGEMAAVTLGNPQHFHGVLIEGTNVETRLPNEELEVKVSLVEKTFYILRVKSLGDFQEYILLPLELSTRDTLHLNFKPSKIFIPSEIGTSKDSRALSFRVSRIAVATDSQVAGLFPESFQFPRDPETDTNLEGIYKDGWMADSGKFTLYNVSRKKTVEVNGFYPTNVFRKNSDLDVYVGGKLLVRQQLPKRGGGGFAVQVQLPEEQLDMIKTEIILKPSGTFVPAERGINPDKRKISYQIHRIALK